MRDDKGRYAEMTIEQQATEAAEKYMKKTGIDPDVPENLPVLDGFIAGYLKGWPAALAEQVQPKSPKEAAAFVAQAFGWGDFVAYGNFIPLVAAVIAAAKEYELHPERENLQKVIMAGMDLWTAIDKVANGVQKL